MFVVNMIITSLVVSLSAWLSGRNPVMAGFMIAMPVTTLLVLPMAQFQHGDPINTVKLAKSIMAAIPISLLFFIPFLLSEKLSLGFWPCYGAGIVLLVGGFFVLKLIMGYL